MHITWVSMERGVCTAWQCVDMGLRAGVTCISQCRGREGGPHSCAKEHCLHDRPAGKLLTASEQALGVSSCACTCWLDQSPWEVSLFA